MLIANSAPNAFSVKSLFTATIWFTGQKCIDCHGGNAGLQFPTGDAGLQFTLDDDWANDLIGVSSSQQPALKRVNPGDADGSYLIRKLEGGPAIVGERMPPGPHSLLPSDIQAIRDWINLMTIPVCMF